MLKILVADDHTIVREGLKQILGEVPDMLVAGEASDGPKTLHMVREDHYDLVLLDIADALSLSVKTISTNRHRALTKMGMKTNADITYYAIKRGLVE